MSKNNRKDKAQHPPSLVCQLQTICTKFARYGQSRHDAKQNWRATSGKRGTPRLPGLYNHATRKRYYSVLIPALRNIREREGTALQHLTDLTLPMVRDYLTRYADRGVAAHSLQTAIAAFRKLEMMLQTVNPALPAFVPTRFLSSIQIKRRITPRGAYTRAQADAILSELERTKPLIAIIIMMQCSAGLRLREVCMLSTRYFPDQRARDRSDDGEEIAGILWSEGTVYVRGKGGRQRTVKLLDSTVLARLDPELAFPCRTPDLKLITQMRYVQKAVKSVCRKLRIKQGQRGTHGFRALAACTYYQQQIAGGATNDDALRATSHWLGHQRLSVVVDHYLTDPPGLDTADPRGGD